jgi:hypothetical protein
MIHGVGVKLEGGRGGAGQLKTGQGDFRVGGGEGGGGWFGWEEPTRRGG